MPVSTTAAETSTTACVTVGAVRRRRHARRDGRLGRRRGRRLRFHAVDAPLVHVRDVVAVLVGGGRSPVLQRELCRGDVPGVRNHAVLPRGARSQRRVVVLRGEGGRVRLLRGYRGEVLPRRQVVVPVEAVLERRAGGPGEVVVLRRRVDRRQAAVDEAVVAERKVADVAVDAVVRDAAAARRRRRGRRRGRGYRDRGGARRRRPGRGHARRDLRRHGRRRQGRGVAR